MSHFQTLTMRCPRLDTFPRSCTLRRPALAVAISAALLTLHARAQSGADQGGTENREARQDPEPKPEGDAKERPTATLTTLVSGVSNGVPLRYAGGRDIIDSETTSKYPDANIGTLVRRVPGVYFLPENGNDSRINIGLRGNDPRRSGLTAVLVDGIPICEAPYGNTDIDGSPIAVERIWKIDVIRNGGSVRYGPNSAGGVVNLLTEPIPDRPMYRVGARYGSNNDYGAYIASGGTWDGLGVLINGVVKGGDGFRENSEYTNLDGSLKLAWALSPTERLTGYISRFDEPDVENPGGLSQADYDADPDQSTRPGLGFDFNMNRYVVGYENHVQDGSTFELKGWYQEGWRRFADFRPVLAPFTQDRVQESDFWSGALEGAWSWNARWFGVEHSLRHTLRYLREMNDEFYYTQPFGGAVTPTLDAKFHGNSFSSFNEDVIELSDSLQWALGFRIEEITMTGHSRTSGDDIAKSYSQFLPESTLTWNALPFTALYASYQQGFYPPQYETGFDPASVQFAPSNPESSQAYEIGARSRELDGLELSVALFDTEFDDKLEYINTPGGLKVPVNIGRARSQGVELSGSYDFAALDSALEGLALFATFTSQRSTIESGANSGNYTPNAPRTLASWGAEYDHRNTGLWARIGGSFSGESYKDLANTTAGSVDGVNGLQPSYTLWDLAAGWRQHPDRTGWSLTAGVTNLLDEDYFRRFSTGIYPGAPRQGFVALGYSMCF